MVSWGVKIDDYGNAVLDAEGNLIKVAGRGMSEELWADMAAAGQAQNLKAGDYKKFNLTYENKILGQTHEMRERMTADVADFVYRLLTEVFSAQGTAPLAYEAIMKAGSFDMVEKASRTENPAEWTEEKIVKKAAALAGDKGPDGNFDD
jgi:fructose-bisphosphate aldolase class II